MNENTNKKNILIIEDESILADIISKKLMHVGYNVDIARDGEEGLRKIAEHMPDLVLLDVRLPKKDGYQVLEQLRADEKTKKLNVLVISNSGQPVEIERMLELGICDYLIKAEFTPQEVLSKVGSCLRGPQGKEHSFGANFSGRQPMNDMKKINTTPSNAVKNKKRVLLVEDDKMLSDLAYMQLFRDGFDVEIAIDGESVLPKLQEWKPDIILLDIRLPDMDGFEVMTQIKKLPEFKSIPIVILSNFDQPSFKNKATELGAIEYLIKANLDTKLISENVKHHLGL